MRVGIFGGSFNPPHNMHREIALNLINKGNLDIVVFVPTGDKYYKDCLIPFEQRLSMVDLMISKYNNLLLSDINNDDNYQYTYQVLDYFKKRYIDDDIYFICGMDNLINLELWVKYQYILNTYKLLVIKRNGENVDNVLKKYQGYIDNIIITELLENELSSTYIRNNIMNEDICKYLDERVYSYIRKNNIYKKVD